MIRRGSGDIINISSLAGKNTFAGGGIYCASKWGVLGLSGCMAEDLREHGIRVSVFVRAASPRISPGAVQRTLRKVLSPEDVAQPCAIVTQGPRSFLSENSPAAVGGNHSPTASPGWIFLLTISL